MRNLFIIIALLSATVSIQAQRFEDYFEDRTLRLDYTFAGDNSLHQIYVDELVSLPHWYGRRDRLAELPLKGNHLSPLLLHPLPGMARHRRGQARAEILRERVPGTFPERHR